MEQWQVAKAISIRLYRKGKELQMNWIKLHYIELDLPEAKTRKMKREKETQTNKTRRNDWNWIFYNWRCAYLNAVNAVEHVYPTSTFGICINRKNTSSTRCTAQTHTHSGYTLVLERATPIQSQKSLPKRIPNKWKIDSRLCIREIGGGFCRAHTHKPTRHHGQRKCERRIGQRPKEATKKRTIDSKCQQTFRYNGIAPTLVCTCAFQHTTGNGQPVSLFHAVNKLVSLYRIHLNAGCVGVYSISYHITMVTATTLVRLFFETSSSNVQPHGFNLIK